MPQQGETVRHYGFEEKVTDTGITTENKGITQLFPDTLITVSNGK
jgi:hypothetical protein